MNDKTQGNKGRELTTSDNFTKLMESNDEDGDLSKLFLFVIEKFSRPKSAYSLTYRD